MTGRRSSFFYPNSGTQGTPRLARRSGTRLRREVPARPLGGVGAGLDVKMVVVIVVVVGSDDHAEDVVLVQAAGERAQQPAGRRARAGYTTRQRRLVVLEGAPGGGPPFEVAGHRHRPALVVK